MTELDAGISRAVEWLASTQEPEGHWDGKASSETIITAWLGYALWTWGQPTAKKAFEWLTANQNPDGGWGASRGQPSYLDATFVALTVLRECAYLDPDCETTQAATRYLENNPGKLGGILGDALQACVREDFSGLPSPKAGVPLKTAVYLATLLPALARRAAPRYVREPLYATALGFAHTGNGLLDRTVRTRATRTLEALWDHQGRWIMPGIGMVALRKFGENPDESVARKAIEWAKRTQNDDGGWGWCPGGQLLDTALPILALLDADVPKASTMIRSAVRRIESQGALEGGWGCHIATPPDADDTAAALLVLRAVGRSPQSRQLARATALLKREQGRGGSWGYPQWIGATRAEETALALWALVAVGEPRDGFAVRQASRWLITNQLPVGSWPTRWYVQDLNSCFRAVFALRAAGYAPSHGVHRLAASYLRSWWQGEDGEPRTSQNVDDAAYSLLGLLEIEDVDSPAVRRAVSWIIEQQTPEGTWSSGYNGFASDAEGAWMSCYRDRVWTHAHALWALARYRRRVGRL